MVTFHAKKCQKIVKYDTIQISDKKMELYNKRYLDMHKSKPWLTLAEVAKGLPLENLLTETDTPYFQKNELFFSY